MMESRGKAVGEAVMLLLLSVVMSRLGIASFIATAPLLLFAIRHGRKSASLLLAAGFAVNQAIDLVLSGGLPADSADAAFLLLNMYFPLSLSAAGIVWLHTRGRRLMGRLFLTLLPAFVLAGAMAAFFYSDRALFSSVLAGYEDAFAALLGPMISALLPGADIGTIAYFAVIVLASLVFPILLCGVCASCFIFETGLHSREGGWEEKVMRLEYSPDAVWGFIISWALILLFRFVSAPLLLVIAVMNAAGVWTVIYAIEGFSVVFARVRRHSPAMRSMTLLILIIAAGTIIPGINFIVLIGLPLLGVLESFFDLKKLGGIDYEDHS